MYIAARTIKPKVSIRVVKRFMEDSKRYTLHKLQPQKIKRREILSPKPRVIIAADVADMSELSRFDRGNKYILVCIDTFSRYVKAQPLKRKDGMTMVSVIKTVMEEDDTFKKASRLFMGRGKEFYNRALQTYLQSKGIKMYSVYSYQTKSSISERFIRTLKSHS